MIVHVLAGPIEIDGEQRAKITALAYSTPPEGHVEWSLRLLADKVVELGFSEHISHSQVRTILKKRTQATPETNLVHWQIGWSLSGSDGNVVSAIQTAIRSKLSCDLL